MIKNLKKYKLRKLGGGQFDHAGLIGLLRDGEYLGGASSFRIEGGEIALPEKTWVLLNLSEGEEIYLSPA